MSKKTVIYSVIFDTDYNYLNLGSSKIIENVLTAMQKLFFKIVD